MSLGVTIATHVCAVGFGFVAGIVCGAIAVNRKIGFIERILRGSLNSPITRDICLGRIRRIGDDGLGMIKLDHPADCDNFEIGDYIRAMCGKHDRFAIAKIIQRDRTRGMITVGTDQHTTDRSKSYRADTPYDWQPGDVLMPFDPIV